MNLINQLIFRDYHGTDGIYEAIAVIKHEGEMTADGDAQGHYICDVKLKDSHQWFRTNDNQTPVPILQQNVTKYGVVTLFRRKD